MDFLWSDYAIIFCGCLFIYALTGLHQQPQVAAKTEGIYEVTFDPKGEGQQRIDVLYGAQPVSERFVE